MKPGGRRRARSAGSPGRPGWLLAGAGLGAAALAALLLAFRAGVPDAPAPHPRPSLLPPLPAHASEPNPTPAHPAPAFALPSPALAPALAATLHDLGPAQLAPPPEWHEFYFTRAAYSSGYGGWGRRGNSWATDFPKSDRQFLTVLKRLTNLDAFDYENAVLLTDENIRRYPFLYALEVGYMDLSPAEIEGLRAYLDAGGFLVIDDFWGSREWAVFEWNMSRVFPNRPIIDLDLDHPVFNTFYDIDEVLQVPAYRRWGGQTWERDGYVPQVKGIEDDNGRLMVIVNWNTDLGDAWEWAEQPDYPLQYSTFAFQMGVNMIIYAMSH